ASTVLRRQRRDAVIDRPQAELVRIAAERGARRIAGVPILELADDAERTHERDHARDTAGVGAAPVTHSERAARSALVHLALASLDTELEAPVVEFQRAVQAGLPQLRFLDRKSTRLNSS